jgi:hypothetical protein
MYMEAVAPSASCPCHPTRRRDLVSKAPVNCVTGTSSYSRFATGTTLMTDDTAKPPLTDDEIVRRLRTIRCSPREERMGRRAPSLRSIARLSGVSHMTIYRIMRTGRISAKAAAVLAQAIEAVTLPYKPGTPFTEKEPRPYRHPCAPWRIDHPPIALEIITKFVLAQLLSSTQSTIGYALRMSKGRRASPTVGHQRQ